MTGPLSGLAKGAFRISMKTISIQSIIDLSLSERHFNSMWYTPKEEAQIWIALIFTSLLFAIIIVWILL